MLETRLIKDENLLTSHPLFEQWAEGLLVIDTNGHIITVNNTAVEILGYEPSELEGQLLHSILCGQAADYQHKAENCPFSDVKNKLQRNHIVDAWFIQKNGVYLHVDVKNVAYFMPDDAPAYYVLSFQDCSTRRYSEKELQRLALFAELNHSPIVEFNEHALISFSNPAMVELIAELGFDHQGMPSVLPDNIRKIIAQCLNSGEALKNIEVDSDGRWFLWNFHPILERSLVQAYGIDISLRKKSEALLFAEKERFLVAFDSIDDAVITVDVDEKVTYLNSKATELTGWGSREANDLPIKNVVRLFNADSKDPVDNILQRVIDQQITHSSSDSLFLAHRDGYIISVKQSVSPMRSCDNKVMGAVIALHDLTDAKRMEQNLNYQATHDNLTGLINRTEFENRLRQSIEHCKSDKTINVLFYIDLDNFKIVNDTCGHVAGDQLLCQVTKIIEEKLRRGDILARLGGDEFGGILEGCPLDRAELIMTEMGQRIQEYVFIWEEHRFNIGASIGLVQINEDSRDIEQLMSMADSSCYAAKDMGRNQVHVYQEDDADIIFKKGEMQWISRINKALLEDRFTLYYQLISPVKSKSEGLHFEILVRMLDEENNIIPPGKFLPAAEHYDIIKMIDVWVVNNTFAWLEKNPDITRHVELCSINLSGHSIGDERFLHYLTEQFKKYHFSANKLCFEVTETAAIRNLSAASHFIDTIKELGCSFSLDDFGSGMSSFAYLKQLNIDYLKIDGLFIKDIVVDPVDAAMVKSINEVGHIMGLKTIAEYVENDDILNAISNIGVDFAQGYGISRPKPLPEVIDLLTKVNEEPSEKSLAN